MAFASRTMILALACVVTPFLARGQGKSELRGRVVSETGDAIAGATITLSQIGYAIRTDSLGAFVLSGTPGSTLVFTLRAAGYRGDTAAVTLPRRSALSREFKLVSEAIALPKPNPSDRVVRGYVMDTEGGALAYATVQINGGRRYIADDSGRFSIEPPSGRFSMLVRRIGFSPEEIKFAAAPDTAIRVRMTAFATALPEQRITGRAAFVSLDLNGFYKRMKDAERGINYGYFVTPEDFELRRPHLISQMAEGHPAVFVRHNGLDPKKDIILGTPCPAASKMCVPVGRNLFRCAMTVYLDRVRIVGKLGDAPDDFVNELVLPSQVAAMEIYPRGVGAPPEYQPSNGSCGVVLIWSK
jgi:hypothetical protein